MRILLTVILLFFSLREPVTAQSTGSDLNPGNLQLSWEVVENNYENKPQFLSALVLQNNDQQSLPATGWKLYFNFSRPIISKSVNGVTIEHVNGDLYYLAPTNNFKAILPGTLHQIEFISGSWAVNYTDAPEGFYLVWDKQPDKGVPINNFTVKPSTEPKQYLRFPGDKIGLITPDIIYNRNKAAEDIALEKLPKIFPTPANYQETGKIFLLDAKVPIVIDPAFKQEATFLANNLKALFGKKPEVIFSGTGKAIMLKKVNMAPDAYTLEVNHTGISIAAASPAGIFYGIQSFKTMLPPASLPRKQKTVLVPGVEVTDRPRFGYRGFMMEVARNFQTKKQVLKVLDLMALYKLNVLHFHLNDDEGWRLEIPTLPELTEIGSKRGHSAENKLHLPPSYGSGPDLNNATGTGYYSKADFIEILKYAKARHIRVIPEIETPGHARAAIKAMNVRYERLKQAGQKEAAEQYLLRDLQDQSVYRSVQYWNDNVINVALPSTYNFIQTVVDDIIKMYQEAGAPLNTIHFGGDEVPAGVWEKSPAVQAFIKNNPAVKKPEDLWYYYFGRVNELLKARHLYLSGWEEAALRQTMLDEKKHLITNPDFVNQNFHMYVWNNVLGWGQEDLAYKLANSGYKVVLAAVSNLYLDMAYQKAFDEPGYYWGSFTDVDKPFYFIPYDYFRNAKEDRMGNPLDRSIFKGKERLTEYGKTNIVGLQSLLWSETIKGPEHMEYMVLPKILGFAERAWSKDPLWAQEKDSLKSELLYKQAWSEFANVLGKKELPRLDRYAGGFQYRIPPPGALVQDGVVLANVQLPGLVIRYTTDGSEPGLKSKIYSGPIAEKGTIKLQVYTAAGRGSKVVTVENK